MRLQRLSCVLLLWVCVSGAARAAHDPLHTDDFGTVGSFQLTDQAGRTVTNEDLRGHICVVSFFYSGCTKGCSTNTAQLAKLYQQLADYPNLLFVSISVNPEHDTPPVLARYAAHWQADPARWLFLTGSPAAVELLVKGSFAQRLQRNANAKPGEEVDHEFRYMVVDQYGRIRGYTDGTPPEKRDAQYFEPLHTRVLQLWQALLLPRLNASLNGLCALLLVLGYLTVKLRWLTLHKIVMLTALAVAALFLGCYLYYHFVVLDGQPTTFTGTGTARYLYFAVLLSHTILAVAIAPMALLTTYRGLRNQLAGHVRLARWTLPLWLYVSVTGVLVWWMLYVLYPPA